MVDADLEALGITNGDKVKDIAYIRQNMLHNVN